MELLDLQDVTKTAGKKPYDGRPCKEGEKLAPFLVPKEEMQAQKGIIIRENLDHKTICGCHLTIGYTGMKEEDIKDYLHDCFWPLINELVEPNRPGRCVVGTKPDGSPKLCPKSNHCKGCENYGKLPRFNPKRDRCISEDIYFGDRKEHDFEDHKTPAPDARIMEEASLEELKQHNDGIDRRYNKMIELRLIGYEPQEIFEMLGLSDTHGYRLLNRAKNEAKKLWHY